MALSVHRRLAALSLSGLFALLLAACAGAPAAPPPAAIGPETQPLRVVATYSILGDLVQNVAGDQITLTTLVGPGGDPHVYEPTPRDSATIAEADLIFENGLRFESWLDDFYAAAGSQARRIVVTEAITPLPAPADGHPEEAHGHAEHDPHVWHDPNNTILMVEAIAEALSAADPDNAAVYAANAAAYSRKLKALDTFVALQVATLPEERRKLVTTHDTFGYFADRYGFTIVGTALGVTTASADPSAGELAELVAQIRASGAPAIFAENVGNPALMETIAREAGVTLAPMLYTDALGEAGSAGATYLGMLRYNITTIVEALAG